VIKIGQNIKLKNRTNDTNTKISQDINAKLRNRANKVVTKIGRNINTKNISA
jgi:hypothetical protein